MVRHLAIVGSLTRPAPYYAKANGCGISVFDFDPKSGRLSLLSEQEGIDNPTYISFDPVSSTIFAVSEVQGWNEGTVSSYRLDPDSGQISYLNKQPSLGSITCQTSYDATHRVLAVTNYSHEIGEETPGQAIALYSVDKDGRIQPPFSFLKHAGSGPNQVRQRFPHPHCSIMRPDESVISVSDLALDKVFHYALSVGPKLAEIPVGQCDLDPGDGPRHFVYGRTGHHLYVVNELSSSVTSFVRSDIGEVWTKVAKVSTLPPDTNCTNLCADLQMSKDGGFLYASNRGHDSVASISVSNDGKLNCLKVTKTGGATPRSMALSLDGRFLVVGNQDSDELVTFSRDVVSGHIDTPIFKTAIGTPMCIKILTI